jgi:hypothetical protein
MTYISSTLLVIIFVIVSELIFLSYTSKLSLDKSVLAIIIFLPSVFMGIPFPLILSEVSSTGKSNEILILLGISGIAGFLGSILVLVLATVFGYFYIVSLGIVIYMIILGILLFKNNLFTRTSFE